MRTPEANRRKQLNRGGNKNTREEEEIKNNVNQTRNMEFETGRAEEKATSRRKKRQNETETMNNTHARPFIQIGEYVLGTIASSRQIAVLSDR